MMPRDEDDVSAITRALQDVTLPEHLEPRGYVALQLMTTGAVVVHIDELPRIRLAQSATDPRAVGWLSVRTRSGGLADVWWPDVREIEVRTVDSIAREHQINRAYEAALEMGYADDADDGDAWKSARP